MKKWLPFLFSLPLFLGSCNKSDLNKCNYSDQNVFATTSEISYLQNYISSNAITAIQHSSGIFYTINNMGTGSTATVCSNITVNYTGSLLQSGTVFESDSTANGVSFLLGQLITGWQKGLPLIKSGGQITLYIPPSLGYGPVARTNNLGVVVIPANSYLKFVIHLLDIQ
jgi:FKBP-type peptidyl-prolyl cis-trans isomerase FkpA